MWINDKEQNKLLAINQGAKIGLSRAYVMANPTSFHSHNSSSLEGGEKNIFSTEG